MRLLDRSRSHRLQAFCLALAMSIVLLIVDGSDKRPFAVARAQSSPTQATEAVAYCLTGGTAAYPQELHLVGPGEDLQAALSQYKKVRLLGGDYSGGTGAPPLTLSSGMQLFGLPRVRWDDGPAVTRVPPIVVAPGATNVLVSSVNTESITFPRSQLVTSGNCFLSIVGGGMISATGATLENNIFLHTAEELHFDNSAGGYTRNNRFIWNLAFVNGDEIVLRGDGKAGQSTGNVFLWHNSAFKNGPLFTDLPEVTFAGIDAEAWNYYTTGGRNLFTVKNSGTFRFFGGSGGTSSPPEKKTSIFDIDAGDVQLYNSQISDDLKPNITLQPTNKRSAFISNTDYSLQDNAAQGARLQAFTQNAVDAFAIPAQQSELQSLLVDSALTRQGTPWERPTFGPVPDPVSQNPGDRGSDATDYIQGLINKGVGILPPGTYYISRPLVINSGHGLIGGGQDKTAIVATNSSTDLIIDNEHMQPVDGSGGDSFVLADLTLQGGKNGIHHAADTAGPGAAFAGLRISHVTFRDMADAGMFLDHAGGWDTNFLDNLTFYHNSAGVKQRAVEVDVPAGRSYIDKTAFFHSQFVKNGIALDLQAFHENHNNMWINSLFQDNDQVLSQRHSINTIFANSDFINNGGAPALSDDGYSPLGCLSCSFEAGSRGRTLAPSGFICEGCTFARGAGATDTVTIVPPDARRVALINTRSTDLGLGPLGSAILINSSFPESQFSQQGVQVANGTAHTFLAGPPNPRPQFLFGSAFLVGAGTADKSPAIGPGA